MKVFLRLAKITLLASTLLITDYAAAGYLCRNGVVSAGDSYEAVERKCGKPDRKRILQIAPNAPQDTQYPHAAITLWFYGPANGAVTQVRFSNDQVVNTTTYRPHSRDEQEIYQTDP